MTQIKSIGGNRKRRVSKSDWLEAALDALKEGGIEAVRIERLAARLHVSKSGFYYHFRGREDLHQKMLDYWLTMDAAPLLQERVFKSATPQERLMIVAEVVDSADLGRFDAAVRQWARQDRKVRRIWRREMGKRLVHILGIFEKLGFEGDDLEMRARTFVGYHVGERELFEDMTKADREKLRAMRIALLVGKN